MSVIYQTNIIIIIILAHWYFIPRGVKTKQIGEIFRMVTLRTRKLKMSEIENELARHIELNR